MDPAINIDDLRASAETERLLEDTWTERSRVHRRQVLVAVGAAVAFLVIAGALAVAGAPARWDFCLTTSLVLAYAALSRIEFPIGRGYVVPTQLALLPMLFALPPAVVPLLVAAALVLGAIGDWVTGRGPKARIVLSVADAWYSIGPAAVLFAAGSPEPELAALGILAVAFAAQWALDTASTALRDWLAFGTPPALQLQVIAQVALVDGLLTPLGFLAAYAGNLEPLAMLLAAPLGGLLALFARDRTTRIRQAHERLEAVRLERTRLQRAVQRIGEAFASTLDFDALLEITLRTSAEAVNADGGRTSIMRPGAEGVIAQATVGDCGPLTLALRAVEDKVVRDGGPAVAIDGEVCAVAWPIGAGDEDPAAGTGVLAVARTGAPFRDDERSLLEYLVKQANVSVRNIAHHEAVQQDAVTDGLTGLANRRHFTTLLSAATERYRVDRTLVSLVLLDIDNFKSVNDTYGHLIGDEVLRETARVVRRACRGSDQPARYGGEELAILVTSTEATEAAALAERVRRSIAACTIPLATGEELRVTASFGVACTGPFVNDPSGIVAAADRALYLAKRTGKNRVEVDPGDPVAASDDEHAASLQH
jgi:diguanylate cyclase (GGDEF)-like protein